MLLQSGGDKALSAVSPIVSTKESIRTGFFEIILENRSLCIAESKDCHSVCAKALRYKKERRNADPAAYNNDAASLFRKRISVSKRSQNVNQVSCLVICQNLCTLAANLVNNSYRPLICVKAGDGNRTAENVSGNPDMHKLSSFCLPRNFRAQNRQVINVLRQISLGKNGKQSLLISHSGSSS